MSEESSSICSLKFEIKKEDIICCLRQQISFVRLSFRCIRLKFVENLFEDKIYQEKHKRNKKGNEPNKRSWVVNLGSPRGTDTQRAIPCLELQVGKRSTSLFSCINGRFSLSKCVLISLSPSHSIMSIPDVAKLMPAGRGTPKVFSAPVGKF